MNEDTPLPFVTDIPGGGLDTAMHFLDCAESSARTYCYDIIDIDVARWLIDCQLLEPFAPLIDTSTGPLRLTPRGKKFLEELDVHLVLLYSDSLSLFNSD